MNRVAIRIGVLAALVLVAGATVVADTLVMRDGRRVNGVLVSVRRGVIEFEERGLWGSGRTIQVSREDVQRIELDEAAPPEDRGSRRPDQDVGRPRGLREREVWVQANTAWADIGLDVRAGQTVYFSTHGGDIQWKRGRHTDADGENTSGNPNRPIPGRGIGALVGKIGSNSTNYFFIGKDEGPIRMRDGGRLFLGINDDYLVDNSGAFRVTVSY